METNPLRDQSVRCIAGIPGPLSCPPIPGPCVQDRHPTLARLSHGAVGTCSLRSAPAPQNCSSL